MTEKQERRGGIETRGGGDGGVEIKDEKQERRGGIETAEKIRTSQGLMN